MSPCTYIDGIGSSQAIDTAGEIVDLAGLDCSSLLGAALNWEHKNDVPAQIVGKILDYKKIFSEKDCDTDRQKHFWAKCQMPFLYILGRLFYDKKDSSKEVAALFLDDAQHPNEPNMVGFSIEGAKVSKDGMVITRSIARKVTITNLPANKTCFAALLPAPTSPSDTIEDLFRTEPHEVTFFRPDMFQLDALEKKEKSLEKDVGSGGGAFIGSQLAASEMKKAVVPGSKYPSSAEAKGKKPLTSVGGIPKFAPTMKEPSKATATSPKAGGIPKFAPITKALDAGSMMAAPSQLTGGAALGKESLDRKSQKSKWLKRAEEAYNSWEKKEEFRAFMKKRMPTLALGEIDAIGKTIALKKAVAAEKSLSKMFASYYQKKEK